MSLSGVTSDQHSLSDNEASFIQTQISLSETIKLQTADRLSGYTTSTSKEQTVLYIWVVFLASNSPILSHLETDLIWETGWDKKVVNCTSDAERLKSASFTVSQGLE